MLRAASLPTWPARVTSVLTAGLVRAADRFFDPLPFAPDRYTKGFFIGLGVVTAFTLTSYWALTRHSDVQWLSGEDRLSEWWSVATYVASAAMAFVGAHVLRRLGHPRIAVFQVLLAGAFIFSALEEISWGQRLFGWSTPEAFTGINEQEETTLHNIPVLETTFYTIFILVAIMGLVGGVARAILHRYRRLTTADFLFPSLLLAPPLLMITVWIRDGRLLGDFPLVLMTYVDLRPIGSELPETLLGLCLVLYTYSNLRRALSLRKLQPVGGPSPAMAETHA